ncbi:histidine kinase dimerization/phospho-acceptor domain-containing protein [Comamonas odontotermitis]|uniref:histidine kinase dimerization/phospho-acceptor domain-containing protein n=1 Tax=Comamonas odontotermitis TaxID=379895 RepID=UPI003750507F
MNASAASHRLPRLQTRLQVWILGALAVVWASFVFWGYQAGVEEADELTDGHLASVAALVLNLPVSDAFGQGKTTPRVALPGLRAHDYQQSMSMQLWDDQGNMLLNVGSAPRLKFADEREGFFDAELGAKKQTWRTFTQWNAEHTRKVTVMVALQERDDLADDIAGQMVLPGLWLLPVVTLVLGLTIRAGLRPLHQLSQDVEALQPEQGQRLSTGHDWQEFRAVTHSINTLLDRNDEAMEHERKLANEVAHELRTPLASISLHAQALQGGLPQPQQAQAVERIRSDALRAGHVLNQILALARSSRVALTQQARPVDVAQLARTVAAEYAQAAWQHGGSLAVEMPDALWVSGHAVLLEVALRNLVENALRHTPPGTQIEVQGGLDEAPEGGHCWLQVCDDGGRTGQTAAAEPVDSLHLGHEITQRIMALHHGSFGQTAAPAPYTTCYRLGMPAIPAA